MYIAIFTMVHSPNTRNQTHIFLVMWLFNMRGHKCGIAPNARLK
uniref:Uncharacterized protein n=1 Tax=Arundo donax TaxID=35708 RepID=A0A0A9BQD4_ARUDO